MRGSPIAQWFLFLLVWSALVIPIYRVTSSQPPPTESSVHTSTVPTWLSLRFSSPPSSFSVHQGGIELWQVKEPKGTQFEEKIHIVFDEFGAELHLQADLPDIPSAMEITLEPDARAIRSQTVWSDGDLDEFITFSWGQE